MNFLQSILTLFGGCDNCRSFAVISQTILGSKFVTSHLHSSLTSVCEWGIHKLTVYEPEACDGLVQGQVDDYFWAILVNEFLDENKFCTFITKQCNTDKYRAIDLDETVSMMLADKPEAA